MRYTNPFSNSDWPIRGGGLVFAGTDIHQDLGNSSPGLSYGWSKLLPLSNLRILMAFDLAVTGDVGVSSLIAQNGIFIFNAGIDRNASGPSQAGFSYWGATALRTLSCNSDEHTFAIGVDGSGASEFDYACGADATVQYDGCSIEITISPDTGGNTYDATCRLIVPGLSIDQSETVTGKFSGNANAYIGIEGAYQGNMGNTHFTVTALQIDTDEPVPITAQALTLTQATVIGRASSSPSVTAQALALTQAAVVARGTARAETTVIGLNMTQAEVRVLTLNIPDPISPDSGYIARTGSPVVSWTPISGAVSYDVETALDAAFTMGVTRFNVTASEAQRGVEFGYTYYWRVRAIGPLGVSQFSTSRTFVVPDPTPAQDFAHDTDGRGYLLGQFKEGS